MTAEEILKAIGHSPGCHLDDLAIRLPSVTWKQVFAEVARLSRNGQVHVTVGAEDCTVRLQIR